MILTVGENTLLHRETLLVVSAGNPDDVTLPVVAEPIGFDFGTHTLFIENS